MPIQFDDQQAKTEYKSSHKKNPINKVDFTPLNKILDSVLGDKDVKVNLAYNKENNQFSLTIPGIDINNVPAELKALGGVKENIDFVGSLNPGFKDNTNKGITLTLKESSFGVDKDGVLTIGSDQVTNKQTALEAELETDSSETIEQKRRNAERPTINPTGKAPYLQSANPTQIDETQRVQKDFISELGIEDEELSANVERNLKSHQWKKGEIDKNKQPNTLGAGQAPNDLSDEMLQAIKDAKTVKVKGEGDDKTKWNNYAFESGLPQQVRNSNVDIKTLEKAENGGKNFITLIYNDGVEWGKAQESLKGTKGVVDIATAYKEQLPEGQRLTGKHNQQFVLILEVKGDTSRNIANYQEARFNQLTEALGTNKLAQDKAKEVLKDANFMVERLTNPKPTDKLVDNLRTELAFNNGKEADKLINQGMKEHALTQAAGKANRDTEGLDSKGEATTKTSRIPFMKQYLKSDPQKDQRKVKEEAGKNRKEIDEFKEIISEEFKDKFEKYKNVTKKLNPDAEKKIGNLKENFAKLMFHAKNELDTQGIQGKDRTIAEENIEKAMKNAIKGLEQRGLKQKLMGSYSTKNITAKLEKEIENKLKEAKDHKQKTGPKREI